MASFTKTAYYSDYETTVSFDVEFDEDFEVDPDEYVEACSIRECGELLDALVNHADLSAAFAYTDNDTREAFAETLGIPYQAPTTPIQDLNLSIADIKRIPGDVMAAYITTEQLHDILRELPYGRKPSLDEALRCLSQGTRDDLAAAFGAPAAPTQPREPLDDALELLSDVDRNRLLGLPDSTLDHLRSLLSEA